MADNKDDKKRFRLFGKKERIEEPQQEEPKTSLDIYNQQKEKFINDPRLGEMDDDRKKAVIGRFFDSYSIDRVKNAGINDNEKIERFKQRFIEETLGQIPKPKKKDMVGVVLPFPEIDLPTAEPATTRVQPPITAEEIYTHGKYAKKYGLPGEEQEFKVTPLAARQPGQSSLDMIKEMAVKKYQDDPAYRQVAKDLQRNIPAFEQAGKEARTALTALPEEGSLYTRMAEKSEFAKTALGFLRGVNEGTAGTLKTLDGAERAFYDALGIGQEDGWFGRAANYMERSLEEKWPEVDNNTMVGKLVYDIGHLTPFFGELMVTPKIGKIGKLENLLTTKGFTAAYQDADIRKEMGLDAKPLVEGLYGGAMGFKDAMAFHLLGYGAGKVGQVVSKAAKSGDAGVTANMLSNGLGFASYDALDQYVNTGEIDIETLKGSFALGAALASPGMMKQLGHRAFSNYYGTNEVTQERVLTLPHSANKLRDMALDLRNQADKATSVKDRMSYLAQAKAFDQAADIKAVDALVTKDPEASIKAIKENKDLSSEQKEQMITRIEDSVARKELEDIIKAGELIKEGKEPKMEKAPELKEKPVEEVKLEKIPEMEQILKRAKRTKELLQEKGYKEGVDDPQVEEVMRMEKEDMSKEQKKVADDLNEVYDTVTEEIKPKEKPAEDTGQPMKLYRGSPEKGGTWFTPDKEAAGEYAADTEGKVEEKEFAFKQIAEREDILKAAEELGLEDAKDQALYWLVSPEAYHGVEQILENLRKKGFDVVHLPKGEDFAPSGKEIESYKILQEEAPIEKPKPEKQPEITPEKPHTFDTQFMDDAALVERIEVADKTIAALDKMEKAGETGEVKDKEAHLDIGNTTQLFGPGRNKVESPEDITRLKQEALEAKQAAQESIERRKGVKPTEGKIKYGEREFDSIDELAEELAKYPIERLPLPEMDIDVFRAMEKAIEIQKERKPAEEPVPEEIAEEKPPKELTQKQKSHNALLEQVRSLNEIPKTHTAKRSKKMAGITRMVTKLGYGLEEKNGKVIALNAKGKRIKTISVPAEYISVKEVKDENTSKFISEFLGEKSDIINLGIPLHGKKLLKAREDVIAGKKNQNSDMLIRELQRMHEEGYIEIREVDEVKRISIEEWNVLMEDQKLTDFINKHGSLDITNIDQALKDGLIKKEDYERTKQQFEEEIKQRVKAELGVEEEIYGAKDIKGKEVEKPKLSEDMRKLAEKVRRGKIDTKGKLMVAPPLFPEAWNFTLETFATSIEGGAKAVEAIQRAIKSLKEQKSFKNLSEDDQKKLEADIRAKFKEDYGIEEAPVEKLGEKPTKAPEGSFASMVNADPIKKKTPPKKVKGPKKEISAEEETPMDKLRSIESKYDEEMSKVTAKRQREGRRMLEEHFVDVHEPFKKAIIKEGAEGVSKFINRINLEAGASARAKMLIKEAQEKIFGKGFKTMSENQQRFLSRIVDLMRNKELDEVYKKRGEKLQKHEDGITGEQSVKLLEQFENKNPELLEQYGLKDYDPVAIKKSIKVYHDVMRDMLTEMHDNGIITTAAYEKLKEEYPHYSPRKYIKYMDGIDPDGTFSGIKKLEGGSEGTKVVDVNTLLSDVVSRTTSLVAYTKKMHAAEAYATEGSEIVKKAPFSKEFQEKLKLKEEMKGQAVIEGMSVEKLPYIESEFEKTPRGFEAVDYYKDGNKHRMWIDKDVYKYFDYQPADEATQNSQHAVSMMLGVPMLKFFATGANPEFAVKNLPLDALHAWMTTTEYSTSLAKTMFQMRADYTAVANDAWTKTGRWRDAMNEGIGMDYLTTQGTEITNRFKKHTKTSSTIGLTVDAMAKIGEFSEIWTRLAIRERYIKNRVHAAEKEGRVLNDVEMKSLQEDATAFARNYLDFSQGGRTVKYLDKFIPYLNAGVQVTRGSLRAAHNNPKEYFSKLARLSGLVLTLTSWNLGQIGDEEEAEKRRRAYKDEVDPGIKARNFIVMTNMRYKDAANRERTLYFKIPKDAMQSSITSLFEDIWVKATDDGDYKLMNDKTFAALRNEFRNVTNLTSLPPLFNAVIGSGTNYDLFYREKIWTGRDMEKWKRSEEYYDAVTPPRFIKFGDLTGASPIRAQYMAKQFFTESNLYGAILGGAMDGVTGGLNQTMRDYAGKEGYEKLVKIPGVRRIMRSSYPKPPEEAEKAQAELNELRTANDHRFNQFIDKRGIEDIPTKDIHDFVDEVGKRDGQREGERMITKFEMRMIEKDVSIAIRRLKWFDPTAAAIAFHKMLKKNPSAAKELWDQADAAKITSELFEDEVSRLMEMDKETEK